MTDAPDLDDRLARLAARRASASSPPDAETCVAPQVESPRRRRRHPAAAGRVFAAGLSSSAFLAIMTALAAQQPASGATNVATAPPRGPVTQPLGTMSLPPTTKAKVVVKTVHHAVYVDQYGRPVSPALVPSTAASHTVSVSSGASSATHSYGATPSASPAVGHTSPVPSNPTPTSPTPKPPTTSPSPPPTSPPVTVHTPPPPPSPPPCTGSKCP